MLGAKQIKEEMELGTIVIDPYNEKQLQINSYDVTLGNWIIRFKKMITEYHNDAFYLDETSSIGYQFHNPERISDEEMVIIDPGERILAHTAEIIGTRSDFVPQLATRSTLKRWGIDVCGSAGFGDVGFHNYWAMEITNESPNSLGIPVKARVGQMYFTRVEGSDKLYDSNSFYMPDDGSEWKPEDMLPKIIVPVMEE